MGKGSKNDLPVGPEFIRIENKIYSSEKIAKIHPGGPLFIKAFSGRDASQAFLSYHRRRFPHSRVKEALYKTDETVDYSEEDQGDFIELCERVSKVLPRLQSFAPWHYYLKVILLLWSAFHLEFYMHSNIHYKWYLAAPLGLVYALIGMNIQHDANHGAVSRRPIVNRILGASQNWIGGSAISWIHQHVVQHHVHTNDVHLDPDISSGVYLRLNPLQPLMKFHIVQHIYFFFLLGVYGFTVVFTTLQNVIRGSHHTPISPLLKLHRLFETMTSVFFLLRWFVLPVWQTGSLTTLLHLAPLYVVAGYYLAFFFSLNHSFRGVHMLENTGRAGNRQGSFLYNQVVSSSNVGGWWLCHLNGGLNYQIEHHLFPRVNHTYYPLIAPIVRQFCQEKDIPYVHFDNVSDNVRSCALHLWDMGSSEKPDNIHFRDAAKVPLAN